LTRTGSGGNLGNDAHLAALALEHNATVVTYDRDFERYAGVRWRRPDDLSDPVAFIARMRL
jgi:predicted nucleic acid-binding protein